MYLCIQKAFFFFLSLSPFPFPSNHPCSSVNKDLFISLGFHILPSSLSQESPNLLNSKMRDYFHSSVDRHFSKLDQMIKGIRMTSCRSRSNHLKPWDCFSFAWKEPPEIVVGTNCPLFLLNEKLLIWIFEYLLAWTHAQGAQNGGAVQHLASGCAGRSLSKRLNGSSSNHLHREEGFRLRNLSTPHVLRRWHCWKSNSTRRNG